MFQYFRISTFLTIYFLARHAENLKLKKRRLSANISSIESRIFRYMYSIRAYTTSGIVNQFCATRCTTCITTFLSSTITVVIPIRSCSYVTQCIPIQSSEKNSET